MEMSPILGPRKKFSTGAQIQILKERLQAKKYLTKRDTHELAMSLNVEEKTIDNWFYYMRRKKAAVGMSSQSE